MRGTSISILAILALSVFSISKTHLGATIFTSPFFTVGAFGSALGLDEVVTSSMSGLDPDVDVKVVGDEGDGDHDAGTSTERSGRGPLDLMLGVPISIRAKNAQAEWEYMSHSELREQERGNDHGDHTRQPKDMQCHHFMFRSLWVECVWGRKESAWAELTSSQR